ncbi:MAG: sigma 54-interacting transcriptional regulator [Nitrospirales bacterium]|nr:sigma 54-interacting transcriptional regulator [Nitrospira sp.]MDR4501023.1 sigma 54-interacting transcriptional regulator [Nitrospirales bacterium]
MELDFRKNPGILSNMVDVMADGVFTVDSSGHIVAWSAGAARITGYSSQDVVGQSCHLLEGQNCKGFSKLTEFLDNPTPYPWGICNQECKVLGKNGRELYLYGNVSVLRDEQGKVMGAIGTFTDLTSFILSNEKIAVLEEQTKSRDAFQQLVGKSQVMQEVFRRLRLAAQSDVSVLLTGESGTGKELAARAIHALSCRKDQPFFAINCSAIPETLLESELFGHVKGAFTGAIRDKVGVFQAADGGTLFLDEIGDTSPVLQLKLLRVLQEGEIRRVGDERVVKVNVRLITATNKKLKSALSSGEIREDFYYRIRVFEITIPPLSERREDIPLLVKHFIEEYAKVYQRSVDEISQDAMHHLVKYSWPGNVRELRNAIEHAFVTVEGDCLTLLDLPPEIRTLDAKPNTQSSHPSDVSDHKEERDRILSALRETHGRKLEAARLLGMSRVTLWKKLQKFGIQALTLPLPLQ